MTKPNERLLAKKVGERIKQAREALEISQHKLAELAGISRSALVHYEQGNAAPGGNELVKLANELKLSPNYLLSGSERYFKTGSIEHSLASDDVFTVVPRMTTYIMALDQEQREAVSTLLTTMVKAKMTKSKYQEFVKQLEAVGPIIAKTKDDINAVVDKALPDDSGKAKPVRNRKPKQ